MIPRDAGCSERRPAFTLVEILVVIFIITVLSAITIAFLTTFNGPASAARGATMVQQTLLIGRTTAIRNQRPGGVRLVLPPQNPVNPKDPANFLITQMQFIEQPDDYFGGRIQTPTPKKNQPQMLNLVQFVDVDLTGGFGINNPTAWPVQNGDYIEFRGTGEVYRILKIITPADLAPSPTAILTANQIPKNFQPNIQQPKFTFGNLVLLQSALPNALPIQVPIGAAATVPASGLPNQYRIIRMPRVVGDDPITLPEDIAIDANTNQLSFIPGVLPAQVLPFDIQTNAIDILFAPSGAVIGRGTTESPIFLWVRNVADANAPVYAPIPTAATLKCYSGEPTIIALYPRTGSTAAHPVNTLGVAPNPYQYALDGRSSGL